MHDPKRILLPLASAALMTIFLSFFTQNVLNKEASDRFKASISFSKELDKPKVYIGETKVYVDIADTPQERQIGLSERKKLGGNEGMLFIFEKEDTRPSFWMEGMNFAIDIIWINDGEVVQIDLNVQRPPPDTPSSELKLYQPYIGIDYVLEVPAGFVKQAGIAVGDAVDLSQIK